MQKNYIGYDKVTDPYNGEYLLVAFKLIPGEGETLESIATEVAAESSTGSNLHIENATEFSESQNALVYEKDEATGVVKIAYPIRIFDRGGNVQSIITYIAGNVFGMGSHKGCKLLDIWYPETFLKNYDGPNVNMDNLREYTGVKDRPILGTIIKPKIGLKPEEFARSAYDFWRGGGDFVKHDEPQADQDFCPFEETVTLIREAMDRAEDETGEKKIHSFNVSAADHDTMLRRAEHVHKTMKPGSFCFLVDGITAGWTPLQTIRRHFPDVFLHFHRAGHGALTREENPIGMNVYVLSSLGRLAGSSGMHTGTAGVGKMSGNPKEDLAGAYALQKDISEGHGYFKPMPWHNIKPSVPIVSGGMNPTKLKAFWDIIGNPNFITTMGGGTFSHPMGPQSGATAIRQAADAYLEGVSIEEWAEKNGLKELKAAIEFYGKKRPAEEILEMLEEA